MKTVYMRVCLVYCLMCLLLAREAIIRLMDSMDRESDR